MKRNIIYLISIALLGLTVSASIAQQDQNVPKTDTEVEKLKTRVSELEDKLQTVENVEKMELAAKLAEAKRNLIDTEFDKLKLELKESNHNWLIGWFLLFLAIIAAVGTPLWLLLKSGINKIIENLKSNADKLIADEVENSLNGFKDAVKQVDTLTNELKEAVAKVRILEPQVRTLNKEHAASVLDGYRNFPPEGYPEQIKELEEQAILDVFSDETRHLEKRMKAAEVLAHRKSTKLVSSILKCLNSYIDSDFDWDQRYSIQHMLCDLINYIGQVKEKKTYETLKRFLEQLLMEEPEVKRFIITSITLSLVFANNDINKTDSLPMIREAIPILNLRSDEEDAFNYLVMLFEKLQDYEALKVILEHHGTTMISEVKERCLNLLEKYEPEFVKEQREEKAANNTEGEEQNESKPTE